MCTPQLSQNFKLFVPSSLIICSFSYKFLFNLLGIVLTRFDSWLDKVTLFDYSSHLLSHSTRTLAFRIFTNKKKLQLCTWKGLIFAVYFLIKNRILIAYLIRPPTLGNFIMDLEEFRTIFSNSLKSRNWNIYVLLMIYFMKYVLYFITIPLRDNKSCLSMLYSRRKRILYEFLSYLTIYYENILSIIYSSGILFSSRNTFLVQFFLLALEYYVTI